MNVEVVAHGVQVYRVKAEIARLVPNKDDKGEFMYRPEKWVTMEQAMQLVAEGAALVDVRYQNEYAKEHLEGAINIPYMDCHGITPNYLKDKKQPIVLYCATGKRCSQAKQSMEYLGYEKLYLLKLNE